jgi:hypothetical protein
MAVAVNPRRFPSGVIRWLTASRLPLSIGADYYFGADSIALRATFGFGAKIADTQRVVKLTVAASDS